MPDPLHITVITGPFLSVPPAPCGAVERVWRDLSGEMAKQGHTVTLICSSHQDLSPGRTPDGITVLPVRGATSTAKTAVNLLKDFFYGLRVARVLKKSDIIVTNSFFLPPILKTLRRGCGPLDVHVARMPKGQIRWYVKFGTERLTAVSSAVSELIAAECKEAIPLTRIISYPIRTDVFVPPPIPRRKSDAPVLLYTGRVNPEKGLDILVKAAGMVAQKYPKLTLKITGPWRVAEGGGGQKYVDSLRALAPAGILSFHEAIYDRLALRDALYAADYYCYPSVAERGETFGIAPLEAMATGLPTVVSALKCFTDFISDGETGLLFDHRATDPASELRDVLLRLLGDDSLASRLSTAGAKKASEFSLKRIADDYLEDFREVISVAKRTKSK